MGSFTRITAQDGHRLDAYVAQPENTPIGALVIVQEIFGVNGHIRGVADEYAKEGYLSVAPALFDRTGPGIELTYEGADVKKAYDLMSKLSPDTALLDIAAAFELAKQAGKGTGVIGFCYGGLMSWLTATRGEGLKIRPSCCVGYYPGGIGKFAGEQPSCPVMLHFGGADSHIGMDQVEAVRAAHPEVEVFVYEGADHAFNRNVAPSYHAVSAKLARERTLAFLRTHIA